MSIKEKWLFIPSLRHQTLILFLIISLVPTIIVGAISSIVSFNNNLHNTLMYNESIINTLVNEADNLMKQCSQIGQLVASDHSIQTVLRNPIPKDIKERYTQDGKISRTLNSLHDYTLKDLFSIYVLGLNEAKYCSKGWSFSKDSYIMDDFFQDTLTSDSPVWFYTEGTSIVANTSSGNYVSVMQSIIDRLSGQQTGIVIIELNLNLISNILNSAEIIPNGNIMLMQNGTIIFSTEDLAHFTPNASNIYKKSEHLIYFSESQKNYIFTSVKLVSGWDVGCCIPLNNIYHQVFSLIKYLCFAILVTLIIAFILAVTASHFILKPLLQLSDKMKVVQDGNLDVNLFTPYKNEIGLLIQSFNNMLAKIRDLTNKIYDNQRSIRKLQFSFLQAQIQPHFLYNTLDSMIWLIGEKKYEDAIILDKALCRLLRISLVNDIDIQSVEKEKEHIENYLIIMKIRFEDKLNYSISIPETSYIYLLPRFTLQPLVENAIQHGIQAKAGRGQITVSCIDEGDSLHFLLSDTGAGIDPEKLLLINAFKHNSSNNGIGIMNVAQRLFLYFHDKAELKLESKEDEGTTVHIIIPKII